MAMMKTIDDNDEDYFKDESCERVSDIWAKYKLACKQTEYELFGSGRGG